MSEQIDGGGQFACDDAGFLDVGALAHLPPWTAMHFAVAAMELALVNAGGRVVAIGDLCLRCGGSLSTAAFAGELLTCPGCGWTYDLLRGCVHGLPNLKIEMHDLRVQDGRLLLASAVTAPAPVL